MKQQIKENFLLVAIIFLLLLAIVCMSACGTETENLRNSGNIKWVVVTRSTLNVNINPELALTTWTTTNNDKTQVVNATLSPTANMTMSNANFAVPTMTSDLLSFGELDITALRDNNLKVCGSGNQKCTAAAIRVYTTGQSGAGFWNNTDSYSAPLNVGVGSSPTYVSTGLNSAGAAYVEQITLAGNKNVVNLSDFSPAPNILVQGDFTNAGSGSYTTTINVEFVVGM